MTSNLSPAQFTGGPAEAKERHNAEEGLFQVHPEDRKKPEHEQGQLFNPAHIPPQEAHHQTPEQFAGDPRTWWHGRFTAEKSRLGGGQGKEGFHAGTEGAARTRLRANAGRRTNKEGVGGHLFPLRITGAVEGPENVHSDVPVHRELGPARQMSFGGQVIGGRKEGYLYKNQVEDAGSISVGVPQRKGYLSTQKEMVKQAKTEGKFVHPNIEWATSKGPEHTGETYPEAHQYRLGSDPKQMQMTDAPGTQGFQSGTWNKAQQKENMVRASYVPEGATTAGPGGPPHPVHVYRYTDMGGRDALSPRQWTPAH